MEVKLTKNYAFKMYKATIICFFVIGFVILGISITLTVCYSSENENLFIFSAIGIPAACSCCIFPLLLYYKHLPWILMEKHMCTSFSFFPRKKLCTVDFNKDVYFALFFVRCLYSQPLQFIAISNTTFSCDRRSGYVKGKSFYGSYNTKQVIVFPYDATILPFELMENWHMI